MTKKEALQVIQQMRIEEKIAKLPASKEAYVQGFIDGVILGNQKQQNHKDRQRRSDDISQYSDVPSKARCKK